MTSEPDSREYSRWREAWHRVKLLDQAFADGGRPQDAQIEETAQWMAGQGIVPRLAFLHSLLLPGMSREALWSVLVPIERRIAKLKITDSEIMEGDAGTSARREVFPVSVVLDSIRSAFNTGSIFRTAECFGIDEILLCGYTATPEHPAVKKAAMGTEGLVRWRYGADVLATVRQLQSQGVKCVALETSKNAEAIGSFKWSFPCAIVLGNERFGVRDDVLACCDAVVRIPLSGAKNSLNVANAFAIAAHAACAEAANVVNS